MSFVFVLSSYNLFLVIQLENLKNNLSNHNEENPSYKMRDNN